jgi:surface polysaccharide O-acyltransferase-like enzyme
VESSDNVVTAPPSSDPRATVRAPHARAHLDWVTWLRVLAILGVVSIHNAAANASLPQARSTIRGTFGIVVDVAFIFAVPLFVMVSGALLLDPRGWTTSGQFVRKRALRLVPPLIFWHVFYIGFTGLLAGELPDGWTALRQVVTGRTAAHLYFFWIVLGLALVAPVLIPWIAQSSRREWLLGGLVATAVPVLAATTTVLRRDPMTFVHTAWTWWIPYLGVFILGWALRGVVLAGARLVGATAAVLGLLVLVTWQWRNPEVPPLLNTLAPVNYYGPSVLLLTVLIFLVGQSTIRHTGALAALTRPGVLRLLNPLGAATMGIFGLHVAILTLVTRAQWFGPAVTSAPLLVARGAAVLVLTCAIVLPLRRVPFVRRVL